jgi:hypothetical protein
MIVAKGVTHADGTYVWTCNKCNGRVMQVGYPCDWCYSLDTDRIIEEMNKGARGQRYYALLKAFLSVKGKDMVDFCRTLHGPTGKLSPAAVGWVALTFGLNFKATCEWLEETGSIRSGAYERIMESHLYLPDGTTKQVKVRDILDAAREKWGQP